MNYCDKGILSSIPFTFCRTRKKLPFKENPEQYNNHIFLDDTLLVFPKPLYFAVIHGCECQNRLFLEV